MAATGTARRRAAASATANFTAPCVSPGSAKDYLSQLKRYDELFNGFERQDYAARWWRWAIGALPRQLRAEVSRGRNASGAYEQRAIDAAMVG
jgi:hypothetical protein